MDGGKLPKIIAVTASAMDENRQELMKIGADDFIGKPFDAAELEARVEAVLRRSPAGQARQQSSSSVDALECATLRVDPTHRRVTCGDRDVALTPTEYAILVALLGRAGQTVSHDELSHAVWGSQTSRRGKALSSHIRSLRAKCGSAVTLSAVPGFGYRLSP